MTLTSTKPLRSHHSIVGRGLFVVPIAAVLALLLSCSSDQVGYVVEFEAIPETKTEGPGCDTGNDSFSIPLDVVTESEGIFGLLDCSALNFRGEGDTSEPLVEITARADIWDACGEHFSWAELKQTNVPAGRYVITPEGVSFLQDDSERFFNYLMSDGTACGTDRPVVGARAVIQWSVCGETQRVGKIRLVVEGTCKLAPPGGTAGTGGTGGTAGTGGTGGEPVDVAGVWNMTATVVSDSCGGSGSNTYQVTITQSGNALTAQLRGGFLSGTINGNRIDLSGTVSEGGGTTTVSMTLTVSADGRSMQGSDDWSWTDGSQNCSGSDSLSGTH